MQLEVATKLEKFARVAELADALDLGSSVFGRGGSSPPSRTERKKPLTRIFYTPSQGLFRAKVLEKVLSLPVRAVMLLRLRACRRQRDLRT